MADRVVPLPGDADCAGTGMTICLLLAGSRVAASRPHITDCVWRAFIKITYFRIDGAAANHNSADLRKKS
jgi:hypothetical protein